MLAVHVNVLVKWRDREGFFKRTFKAVLPFRTGLKVCRHSYLSLAVRSVMEILIETCDYDKEDHNKNIEKVIQSAKNIIQLLDYM